MNHTKRIVILISGRGSNMEALIRAAQEGRLPGGKIVAVLSNRPDAVGLKIAANAGIATQALDHKNYADRASFDAALAATLDAYAPDLIVLAGFMRILTESFTRHFEGKLLNIHPSLLPAFPGLHTHQRALDEGVRLHGCTVHFVTPALDHGPIILQAAVPVLDDDDEDRLAARVLAQEHEIYPRAVRWFLEGRLSLSSQRVRVQGAQQTAALQSPQL
jgi:phosphoribosylglycinamide formyltransferase-1